MKAEAMTTVGDASDGRSERPFIDNKTSLVVQRQIGRGPISQCLVQTKTLKGDPLPDLEFEKGLKSLERLQRGMYDTFGLAVGALLTFAVGYLALYEQVARNKFRVDRLDKSLNLDSFEATRLRTIAAEATTLKSMQEHLPSTLEPLYEVTLALKKDEGLVRKAIAEQTLTPHSTLKDVRALRHPVNVIGTVLKGREVRGGKQDSKVSIYALTNIVLHLTFRQDRVLRVEELSAFQQKVEAALRETFEVRGVEAGILDEHGDWKGPADMCRYLETYWKLKDEFDELTRTAEAQADASVNGREFESQDGREQAWRKAVADALTPFRERRRHLQEQSEAVFSQ